MSLKQKIDIYNSDTLSLKQELEQYITDKSISLESRWNIWCEAPMSLKSPNLPLNSSAYRDNVLAGKRAAFYEICMKEHYKYLQYDLADMDDFERGCIVGRKLQSEKLARMVKNVQSY